jgi:hypothetical protein
MSKTDMELKGSQLGIDTLDAAAMVTKTFNARELEQWGGDELD